MPNRIANTKAILVDLHVAGFDSVGFGSEGLGSAGSDLAGSVAFASKVPDKAPGLLGVGSATSRSTGSNSEDTASSSSGMGRWKGEGGFDEDDRHEEE